MKLARARWPRPQGAAQGGSWRRSAAPRLRAAQSSGRSMPGRSALHPRISTANIEACGRCSKSFKCAATRVTIRNPFARSCIRRHVRQQALNNGGPAGGTHPGLRLTAPGANRTADARPRPARAAGRLATSRTNCSSVSSPPTPPRHSSRVPHTAWSCAAA